MRNILQYLEETAASQNGLNGIVDSEKEISYRDLLLLSQKVGAGLLEALSTDTDEPIRKPIPVFMDKGVDTLSAFMGAIYAGCFYVLINPELPADRIKQILSITMAELLVTDLKYFDRALSVSGDIPVYSIENLQTHSLLSGEKQRLNVIREKMIDTDPLYANFTSGSTGIPKGVLVSHRSVIDFIDQYTHIFDLTSKDIIGNQAPFDFDVSVKDIYSAIKTGARLVIIEKSLFSKPVELLDYLCENEITVMTWAVSALCLITTFHALDYKIPRTVKKVLFSGEVMPIKHLEAWKRALPDALFVNLYGPTEITCNCTYHIIDRGRAYPTGIPIGKAFPNERVFLLDDQNRIISPCQNGENTEALTGEICVSGTALALGYYNSPEETQRAFVNNPANTMFEERIYRTGDIAYYDENGDLVFSGRKDFQIKHMGHRIELEEIERAMMLIDGIERSCCTFDQEKSRLTGFYVGDLNSKDLHEMLSAKLPIFMVPGTLRKLKKMPLTKNGKIDRKLLSVLATDRKAYKRYLDTQTLEEGRQEVSL